MGFIYISSLYKNNHVFIENGSIGLLGKGSLKKSSSLNGRAIKALPPPPPPIGLNGNRFFIHYIAGNGF